MKPSLILIISIFLLTNQELIHESCSDAIKNFKGLTCLKEPTSLPLVDYESYVVMRNKSKAVLRIYTIQEAQNVKIFERERLISKTQESQYVLKTLEVAENEVHFYQLTEFVGMNLERFLGQLELYTEKAAVEIFSKIVEAVQLFHSHHLIHANLSGQSIYLNEKMEPKIGDFFYSVIDGMRGLRVPLTRYSDPNSSKLKSRDFVCDERVDVYSLGIILFRMLELGQFPFNRVNPIDLSILQSIGNYKMRMNTSVELMFIISGALRFKPEDRLVIGEIDQVLKSYLLLKQPKRIQYNFVLSNKVKLPNWIIGEVRLNAMEAENSQIALNLKIPKTNPAKNVANWSVAYLRGMVDKFKSYLPEEFRKVDPDDKKNGEASSLWETLWGGAIILAVLGSLVGGVFLGIFLKKKYRKADKKEELVREVSEHKIEN